MIFETGAEKCSDIAFLYKAWGMNFPLILAVIQKQQRGQIFSNKKEDPNSAVVITDFGFMCFLGMDNNDTFNSCFTELLATIGTIKPNYLLWYSPPLYWQQLLDVHVPINVRRRERMIFEFCEDRADYLKKGVQCPTDFGLKNLDIDLMNKTEKFGLNIESRYWSTAADFIEHGLGVCLIKNGEVASLCYSACVVDNLAVVDIMTLPEYRGQGLATIVAQQFIRECMNRGITPTWDCFVSNISSVKLAEKLGFAKMRTYLFYSFNVPLELTEKTSNQQEGA